MAFLVYCPNPDCGKKSSVGEEQVGQAVRCKYCGTPFPLAFPPVEARTVALTCSASSPVPSTADEAEAPSPSADLLPSIGRFEVRQELGAGAFGRVYRAYDPQLDREVALKVPHPGTLAGPCGVERFLREARAAAQLCHPGIVPVHDAGRDGSHYYIASAFIAGRTLEEAIEGRRLGFREAARVVRELPEALAYAHGLSIVHRDVKPANVMLDGRGRAHLMDFGLAHRQDAEQRLTHDGAVLGTPAYMAPEQAEGSRGSPCRPATSTAWA